MLILTIAQLDIILEMFFFFLVIQVLVIWSLWLCV